MDSSNKAAERSGYTSPDVPPTPATTHLGGKLRRTASEETLATTFSGVSSTPSLIYPAAPLNTPATQSIAGDNEALAADMKGLAEQLERASLSPPASPASDNAEVSDRDPLKEGKAHLRAQFREDLSPEKQLFKSPGSKRPISRKELIEKYHRLDRFATPTLLSFMRHAPEADAEHASSQTFEYSSWGPVAEEDTERALKRMAMLARDEHKQNPQHSVKEYYSMRLAKLIEEAEVEFDASKLQ